VHRRFGKVKYTDESGSLVDYQRVGGAALIREIVNGANDGITARVGRRAGRAVVSEVHRQAAGRVVAVALLVKPS